jgi:poly(3-hydroxybutyrate) depolymerase
LCESVAHLHCGVLPAVLFYMHRVVLLLSSIAVLVRTDATPAPSPCSGCTLDVASASTDPVPLVVVLHGDGESARERAARWRDAVLERGWALLALDCPNARGCTNGSWYKWDGDPTWVHERVHEVADRIRIDSSRIYLVGWSGGATYIGQHLQHWPRLFAAVVIHGGGVPPRSRECPTRPFPAYFLVGDHNPTHGATKRLRAYFDACDQELIWDLQPGANHDKEDAALTREKASAILRWLETRRRPSAWT